MAGRRLRGLSRREVGGGALAGFVLFAGAAFQQAGLAFTTAGKAGFITGLYVVLVPLLLTLFWRQRSGWNAWVASLLASVGLFLLSAEGRLSLAPGDGPGAGLGGPLRPPRHPDRPVGRADGASPTGRDAIPGLWALQPGPRPDPGIPFLGSAPARRVDRSLHCRLLRCCGATPLQMLGQADAPPTVAAVILSLESVFAALFGGLFLGERLAPAQWVGGGLMLVGMVLAQVPVRRPAGLRPSSRPAYTKSPAQRTPE
jgi:uncharacterized membrane protein